MIAHGKDIKIFSGSSNRALALAICDLCEKGMGFGEVSHKILEMRDKQQTYFVLDSLEYLRKNGRLTGLQAFFATALNIKPVMGATPEGTILQLGQARGVKKALAKMTDEIIKDLKDSKEKVLAISHCNCKERAEYVRDMLMKKSEFKSTLILDTAGISSMYAADGGVIVVV